jgi:hypothetical protein
VNLDALSSAAAFLRNEAHRRPVAPEQARPDAARIPNSLRQKWLADAADIDEIRDFLETSPD